MRVIQKAALVTLLVTLGAVLAGCGLGDTAGGGDSAASGSASQSGAPAPSANSSTPAANPARPAPAATPSPPAAGPIPDTAHLTAPVYIPTGPTLQEAVTKGWVSEQDAKTEFPLIPYHALEKLSSEYVKGPFTLRIPGDAANASTWRVHKIVSPTLDEAVKKAWVTQEDARNGFGFIVTQTFQFLSTEYGKGSVELRDNPFGAPTPAESETTRIEAGDSSRN